MATVKFTNRTSGKTLSLNIADLSKKYMGDFLSGKMEKKYFFEYLKSKCPGNWMQNHLRSFGTYNVDNLDINIEL